ncbi:hypothetical protein CRYUN_Cryun21dG0097900 [Craigia yunnanensis]
MAVVMKQQDRAEEAIEAIKSFRDRCSKQVQESLDNVLIDLYKLKEFYRKAQIIDPDANKACNLCQCLIKQARYLEAQSILEDVIQDKLPGSSDPKSRNRVKELLQEFESQRSILASTTIGLNLEDAFLEDTGQGGFLSSKKSLHSEIS